MPFYIIFGIAQVPTCDDYAPTSTQQWGLNPTLNHVFLDEFNSHTAWYKFPIVRNRQYFRFKDIDDQGNLPVIFYQIYQLGLGAGCSELELIYSGSLGNIDDEIYAEPFEVGNNSGYIKFSSFEDINLKFAVMYGDPANGTENGINVQDYEGMDYENSSTLALPEDPNVNGVVAWYNFSVGSTDAYFLDASSPIPTYPGIVALHRSDYSIVNMGASDYYNPNCLTSYLLTPGSYKIKVMSFVNSAPGFAHISLHGPPSNTAPNDRMVNATDLVPATYGNHNFIHATIQHASVSPQVTLCTNEYSGQQQLGRDIWYQFTATQSSYYFIIKNIEDIAGNLGQIKISVLTEDGQGTIGSSCEQFFPMGANEEVKVIEGLTPGNLYKLRLVGFNNNFVCEPFHTEFDFCLARPDCISNDDCASSSAFAAPLPGQDATLSGTTYCAELLASGDCNTSVEKSAWWSFTATQTGYDFTLTALNDVFNGGFNGVDVEITSDCNGATVPGTCKTILLNQTKSIGGLTIGQTYYLRIRTGLNDASFSLLVHAPELDEADACSSTAILPVSSACNFTNISTENATQSPEGTCASGNNDDVWYNFTASSPIIRFDVDNIVALQGSVTVIYFGIYESCNGALVACFALNEPLDHEVSNLSLGQTYKLQMFTFGEDNRGTFDVCLESISTVPNDDCANATPVSPQIYNTSNPTPIAVNTMGASAGVNDCDDNMVDDDLWYSFTASSNSYLFKHSNFVTTNGFAGSTAVKVEFFETCGGASIGCYYLFENSARVVVLTQGQSYRYRIWTEQSSISATFDLLHLQLPNTPANDYCNAPVPVTVAAFDDPCNTVAGSTLGGTYSLDFECGFAWWDDVYFSFTADYSSVALTLDNFTQLWGGEYRTSGTVVRRLPVRL